MGRPRIDLDVHEVAGSYESGTPIAALARQHGVDRDVIRRCLDEAGITRRPGHVARIGDTRWWEQYQSTTEGAVTSVQLQERAGITYRQLDYWTRTGRLETVANDTPGSGNLRAYLTEEVAVATLMRILIDSGVTVEVAATAARELTERGFTDIGPFRLELPQEL